MTRVAWLTDIHLNFVGDDGARKFLATVAAARPEAVLLSGDISESHDLIHYLRVIAECLACPVYFVLGNHDFYFGSIRRVREQVATLCAEIPNLVWLTQAGVVGLTPQMGLIGHDGWADARFGDYERSLVMMNDYRLIEELSRLSKKQRWPLLQGLGDEAAEHVRQILPLALSRYPQVVLVTHVPPFREACLYEGKISNDEWLPHFASKAMGDAIVEVMREHPDRRLTVLCGHTHSAGDITVPTLPNVQVLIGGAEYNAPQIQRVFEFA